jgi:hypothetical protein
MIVTRGLIIGDPWIGHILSGRKTWEMRSQSCSIRGMIGLIRKGTGAVWGAARLYGVGAPLSPDEMVAAFDKHAIPEDMIRSGKVAGWNVPWKLSDIVRFQRPVPYAHKSGAVTFVIFDENVGEDVARQMGVSERTSFDPVPVVEPRRPAPTKHREPAPLSKVAPTSSRGAGTLLGQVELTEGNIKNQHIYLRGFFSKFPEDAVGGSNKSESAIRTLSVDWGGGSAVETDLDGQKKFFRARGWIKSFFEANDAQAGDTVFVEEISPYRVRVSLQAKAIRR